MAKVLIGTLCLRDPVTKDVTASRPIYEEREATEGDLFIPESFLRFVSRQMTADQIAAQK